MSEGNSKLIGSSAAQVLAVVLEYVKRRSFLLFLYMLTITIVIPLLSPSGDIKAKAANTSWTFDNTEDYDFDSNEIVIANSQAELIMHASPGTNWITTDGNGNNWASRKPITISNSGLDLTEYQTLINIDTSTLSTSACEDVRFTSSDKTTIIPHWLESGCKTSSTRFWVKVPNIAASPSTTTIYYYYGNANATNISNGSDVFQMFDDFNDGSIDSTKWTEADPRSKINEADGKLKLMVGAGSGGWDTSLYSKTVFPRGTVAFEFDMIWLSDYTPYDAMMFGWKDNGVGVSYTDLVYGYYNGGDGSCSVNCSSSIYEDGAGRTTATWSRNTDYKVRMRLKAAGGNYYERSTDGGVSFITSYNSSYSTESNLRPAWMLYSGDYHIDNARVRKWSDTEPVSVLGSSESLSASGGPTVTLSSGQGYVKVSSFVETLGTGSSGSIKYQVSPNDGTSWYWYDGNSWEQTSATLSEANIASEINEHFYDESFDSIGSGDKYFKWRAYFISDGSQHPILDSIEVEYIWDTGEPDNPNVLSVAKSTKTGGEDIEVNNYYNYASPYFSWEEPDDSSNDGEEDSGIDGYYVYFGTDASADPHTTRGLASELGGTGIHYQVDTDFEISIDSSALASAQTYYLRIETKDGAGNINHIAPDSQSIFTYMYDNISPTSPLFVSASPSGYSRTNNFVFTWPIVGSNRGDDSGGSGLLGYQYRINSGEWSETISTDHVSLENEGIVGVNIFYLRTVDNASNVDQTPVQTNFYFNNAAPTAPTNLSVDPSYSTDNSFSFTWGSPLTYNGSVAGYYYSINYLPTISNVSFTTESFLPSGPYATQQGENTLYLVAKDEAGNYDFASCSAISGNPETDGCAKALFTADTSAPGTPTGLSAVDGSNRDTQSYKIFLTWTAPAQQGTGFAGYEIYRSIDGLYYSSIGTTSGTTYADTGLESIEYHYYIKSRDNANQYSVASTPIMIIPTGRYTTAPVLTEDPQSTPKAYSTIVLWETDREASSFVYYATSQADVASAIGVGQPEKSKKHTVQLTGLQPETTYYYQTMWEDSDGNQGRSQIFSFQTGLRPKVTDVRVSNITLNSATISYKTTSSTTTEVLYGRSSAYGGSLRDDSGSQTTNHSVSLQDLDHSATYHYTVRGTDIDGNILDIGTDFVFDTLPMPQISNLKYESVLDSSTTSLRFSWKTNVATTSIVSYTPTGGSTQTKSIADYSTDHDLTISDLADQSVYTIIAKGVDQFGNQTVSDANSFTTPIDTRPPKISDLTIESSNVGLDKQDYSQLFVSWKTDEPATSMVEYGLGLSGDEYSFKTPEEKTLVTNHLVIVTQLEPNKSYHLRVASTDKGNNITKSDDENAIPGDVPKSVLKTILESLESVFGWLGNII